MNGKTIRWGVLSTANIGRAAVNPAIQASRNGSLDAVASRDAGRARDFAVKHEIARSYGSYEALLADAGIDAVYIPLPNSMHKEWSIRAAEAGKHVLCEKPLASNEAECREMEAAAAASHVVLMEAFMYRFHPRIDRTLEMIRNGAIGDVRSIRSTFTFRLTRPDNIRLRPDLAGGALMDVGCYCVNFSRTVAGEEPVEAQAYAVQAASGVDEQLAGTLRFANGIIAQFDCALSMERREYAEVAGTEAQLTLPATFLPGTADVEIVESRGRVDPAHHAVKGADEYRLMVEHFADCVLERRAPRFTVGEAAHNMRVIDALYRSARNGGRPEAL